MWNFMWQNNAKLIIIGAHIKDPSEDENVTSLQRTQNKKSPFYKETICKILHSKKRFICSQIITLTGKFTMVKFTLEQATKGPEGE